ncbi:hypothetical protein Asulf_00392 [Archaeoglobus sulfaticallidus PM70-1]|uniref:Uncharacterized protein n=1 Tax=Archaeoglobus sulfaticallidus PM70-1 TaxID=387631 RepID=N0BA03_9EURY|nr:hypothetical protein Asulf_00392 [Archaeoglobus sulfaticallidus PM70-1]
MPGYHTGRLSDWAEAQPSRGAGFSMDQKVRDYTPQEVVDI